MRIAFDATPLVDLPRTGIGWYTAELVEALARTHPEDELSLWPITWRRGVHDIAFTGPRAPARLLWAAWRHLGRPALERFVSADVFHGPNFLAPPARRTPVVVTVHDLAFVRHPETVHPARRRDLAELLPGVLRRAAGIVCVSAFTKGELAEWMPEVADKVVVVHQGPHRRPPADPSGDGVSSGPPYALFVGTLDARKNLPLLLDALRIVRARGVELRVVLAGKSVVELPRDDGVVVTGYASDARVAAMFASARLFAFPSRYEGFGMPLVEAMQAGLPIVAARAGSTPEITGDAALLVDPDDPEELADAMCVAASDEAVRARLVAAGRARSIRFDWDDTARRTRAVYEEAINRTSRPGRR